LAAPPPFKEEGVMSEQYFPDEVKTYMGSRLRGRVKMMLLLDEFGDVDLQGKLMGPEEIMKALLIIMNSMLWKEMKKSPIVTM
jgi:hypothetical protein